jgi:hypothetical protein
MENISNMLSSKKSSIISDTFVGSEEFFFTAEFPANGPRLGILSSITHVVAPAFEVSLLSSLSLELFDFHCNFVFGAQFLFSHRIITVALAIIKNILGTLNKLSDNNSGRITSSVRNVFAQ